MTKGAINTLRPRQNGRHFADDIFKCIFSNENVWIPIKISLKFVPKGPINNIPALVQIMVWCRAGDKPLSEPMMVCLLTYICVTRPQWVNNRPPLVQVMAISLTGHDPNQCWPWSMSTYGITRPRLTNAWCFEHVAILFQVMGWHQMITCTHVSWFFCGHVASLEANIFTYLGNWW